MTLDLSTSLRESLPAPDNKGLVRVTVGLKVSEDGKSASIVEMNDVPLPDDDEKEAEDKTPADEVLADKKTMPSPDDMERALYS